METATVYVFPMRKIKVRVRAGSHPHAARGELLGTATAAGEAAAGESAALKLAVKQLALDATGAERLYEPIFPRPKYQARPDLEEHLQSLIGQHGFQAVRRGLAKLRSKTLPKTLPKNKGGRPSTELLDMHLAEWFYQIVEEYRQANNPKPIQTAEADLHEMTGGIDDRSRDPEQLPHDLHEEAGGIDDRSRDPQQLPYARWQKLYKARRLRGLNAWRAYAQKLRESPELARAAGLTVPDWLKRHIKK
jgi:hypothetical protein